VPKADIHLATSNSFSKTIRTRRMPRGSLAAGIGYLSKILLEDTINKYQINVSAYSSTFGLVWHDEDVNQMLVLFFLVSVSALRFWH